MRTAVGLILLLLLALVVWGGYQGWIKFSKTDDETTIRIDRQEARDAAEDATESGRELLRDAGEAMREAGEELREAAEPESAATP